jgi:uncharacterized membrane protein YphA (DoxX/SURF4 family)
MRQRVLALVRIALGAAFVYAALGKVPNMAAFAQDVANYRLVPAAAVPALGSALVGVELLAGLALMAGLAPRGAALVVSVLLGAFVAALSQALARGIDVDCGCFGGKEPMSWSGVARDLVLLGGGLLIVWLGPGRLRGEER